MSVITYNDLAATVCVRLVDNIAAARANVKTVTLRMLLLLWLFIFKSPPAILSFSLAEARLFAQIEASKYAHFVSWWVKARERTRKIPFHHTS